MSSFSLKYPYFIIVACLLVIVVGVSRIVTMPVDLFPPIKIPVVVVATFYNGMPAEQVEKDITGPFERFFTLGSGISRIESTSLPGGPPSGGTAAMRRAVAELIARAGAPRALQNPATGS